MPLVLPGLWEGGRALGAPALVVGLRGGVGDRAADPPRHSCSGAVMTQRIHKGVGY